jgi:hypothetical protein
VARAPPPPPLLGLGIGHAFGRAGPTRHAIPHVQGLHQRRANAHGAHHVGRIQPSRVEIRHADPLRIELETEGRHWLVGGEGLGRQHKRWQSLAPRGFSVGPRRGGHAGAGAHPLVVPPSRAYRLLDGERGGTRADGQACRQERQEPPEAMDGIL